MNEQQPINHQRLADAADAILRVEMKGCDTKLPPPSDFTQEELVEAFRFLTRCGLLEQTEAH